MVAYKTKMNLNITAFGGKQTQIPIGFNEANVILKYVYFLFTLICNHA